MEDVGDSRGGAEGRAIVYCVVPRSLAARLHEPLRRHFRDDPRVVVVVEARAGERRNGPERRTTAMAAPRERRRIHNVAGRRIADRRAGLLPVGALRLPRRAQRHVDELSFVERVEPSSQHAEDLDTARLVTRIQAGDQAAFAVLYMRYFDRVYGYLRMVLRQAQEAEDGAQQVFLKALEALPRYERRAQPLRGWLFVIARNYALQQLEKQGRTELLEPEELTSRSERACPEPRELPTLDWISDPELVLFVERLPLAQRQVLMLRYTMGFSTAEIADILGRKPDSVRKLQTRGLSFLKKRLAAVGRHGSETRRRAGSVTFLRQARVVRVRRYALRRNMPTG